MSRRASRWIVVPALLSLAYAIAVVVATWGAPDKEFHAFTDHRIIHVEDDEIMAADLDLGDRVAPPDPVEEIGPQDSKPHDAVMDEIERRRLSAALAAAEGNQSREGARHAAHDVHQQAAPPRPVLTPAFA